jgi:hypothetical protein
LYSSHFSSLLYKALEITSLLLVSGMGISLLTLPYELREQIIMPLLYQEGSITLQRPVESPSIFTPPIIQVCKVLREEAIRVFYYANTFTWTIDPEAVSSTFNSCMIHALEILSDVVQPS